MGPLDIFDVNGEEPFELYVERVEFFCIAKNITSEEEKKATFLTAVGAETYGLIRNLLTPDKPKDKTLKQIQDLVEEHLSPKKNVIVERFRFNSRNRKEGESVAEYIVELKRLARNCKFEDKLNDMLRDRIVCGIGDTAMQRKMLMKEDLK